MSNLGNKEIMAQNIRRYCDQKGMSMMKLSEELDVPYNTVCNWCNAVSYPRIDKIERMANLFGVTKADLVEDENDLRDEILEKAFRDRPEMRTVYQHTFSAKRVQIDDEIDGYFSSILSTNRANIAIKNPVILEKCGFFRGSIPLGYTKNGDKEDPENP